MNAFQVSLVTYDDEQKIFGRLECVYKAVAIFFQFFLNKMSLLRTNKMGKLKFVNTCVFGTLGLNAYLDKHNGCSTCTCKPGIMHQNSVRSHSRISHNSGTVCINNYVR